MRRQALEHGGSASQDYLEMALIERQGLAAWIMAGPTRVSSAAVLADALMPRLREAQSPPHDLVLALVDLVMSGREEEQNG